MEAFGGFLPFRSRGIIGHAILSSQVFVIQLCAIQIIFLSLLWQYIGEIIFTGIILIGRLPCLVGDIALE